MFRPSRRLKKELADAVAQRDYLLSVLLAGPDPPEQHEPSPVPLYLTEEEEDFEWQLAHELVHPDIAQDILRELEFDNTDVHIDDVHDRSSLSY